MSTDEATVNTDGSTTFSATPPDTPPGGEPDQSAGGSEGFQNSGFNAEETLKAAVQQAGNVDPAVYLMVAVVVIGLIYLFFVRSKKETEEVDGFFSELDGEKFNLKLPAEVEEYYKVKEKCETAGWEPGKGPPPDPNAAGPYRVLAQALMKRAIADIPMVQHIQKESSGMNKLYSQSMCSVNQWRAYQAAEALVSSEVEEVRAEADEIEPGWSQAIWRQAMQYHQMLKQKHEMEAKAAEEQAQKRKQVEQKVMTAKQEITDAEAQEIAAQQAAEELIRQEEREKESKKAFPSGGGMKKGFLGGKGKKK